MGMIEIWRDIEGYEGLYQVSSEGRVRSLDRYVLINNQTKEGTSYLQKRLIKGVIMKQKITQFGYMSIALTNNGHSKTIFVHRLVAQAFIPNPNNLPQVNHKSGVKTDNCVENLEWCTCQYNINYSDGVKKRIETRNKNKSYHYQRMVGQYSLDDIFINAYESATATGFNRESIRDCCLGKQKTAYGFKWKYLN